MSIPTWAYPIVQANPNDYPVWPEDDGTDSKRNPYSPV